MPVCKRKLSAIQPGAALAFWHWRRTFCFVLWLALIHRGGLIRFWWIAHQSCDRWTARAFCSTLAWRHSFWGWKRMEIAEYPFLRPPLCRPLILRGCSGFYSWLECAAACRASWVSR